MRRYLRMNWDRWFLVALVLLVALAVGGILGAFDDTIRQIRAGY